MSDSEPAITRVTGTTQFVQGYAREALWSYKWAGLDDKGNPQIYGKDGQKVLVPEIDALEYSGTRRPKYTGGWINQFRYKAVELSFMMVYNFGHVLRREIPTMNPWESTPQTNEQIGQRWRKPGDELITDIPSIMDLNNFYDRRNYPTLYSNNSVINGGFVRFREIQLNYSLPKKLIGSTPLKLLRVYGQVNNLGIMTKNGYNIDPEANDSLTGAYNLPEPVTYTLGIKADF
ncbi:hypothetical protein D3C80_1278980 [compost metagenome]